jgi:hypothetical protein
MGYLLIIALALVVGALAGVSLAQSPGAPSR